MERTRVWRGRVKSESRAEHERFVEWLNTAEAKEQYRKFLLTGYSLAQQGDDLTVLLSSEEPPADDPVLAQPEDVAGVLGVHHGRYRRARATPDAVRVQWRKTQAG